MAAQLINWPERDGVAKKDNIMAPPKKPYSQLCDSAKHFRTNKKSRDNKNKISKKVNARPEQIKKRVESGRARKAAKKRGVNVNGKDYDHASGRMISSKKNRGRRGEGNRKKK